LQQLRAFELVDFIPIFPLDFIEALRHNLNVTTRKRRNASMTASPAEDKPRDKKLTLRWPRDLWEAVSIHCTKTETSLQVLITEAVCKELNLKVPDRASRAA